MFSKESGFVKEYTYYNPEKKDKFKELTSKEKRLFCVKISQINVAKTNLEIKINFRKLWQLDVCKFFFRRHPISIYFLY